MPWVVTDLLDLNVRDKPHPRVVPSSHAVKRQYVVANLADYIGVGDTTNRRALLLGHVNKWANDVGPSSGNNSPQNSVPSNSHSNLTPCCGERDLPTLGVSALLVMKNNNFEAPKLETERASRVADSCSPHHPPSLTVPSLTTNATSVSSAASDTIPVYSRTPLIIPSGLLTHDESGDDDKDQQGAVPVRFTGYHKTKLVAHMANAHFNLELEESDNDFNRPISNMALASSKCKHTDHSSEYVVTSEVDEVDDDGHHDRNIHLHTPKAPEHCHVTAMLVKKAKTSNNFSEQGANTATCLLMVWCSNFGSTAITIIAHFLVAGPINNIDAKSMDLPAIQETCNDLLERFSFLCQDLDHQNPTNTFHSQFILQLLAHTHLQSCVGCPDIPALRMDTLKAFGVQGALALSCAVLKCAIQLFQRGDMDINNQISTWGKATVKTPLKLNRMSGKESLAALAFLEQNWGMCTRHYYMSVAKCDHLALTEIISMVNALVSPAMDSLLDDGSLQVDSVAEDLATLLSPSVSPNSQLQFLHLFNVWYSSTLNTYHVSNLISA
ncbi:hypothetical protein F5J12DRAFT_783420 [Pisolithus orientalis]|uniref:uncharacterized protein n=1 Tax=Pisolithus orientalis TaxID=936130 RepID=UPI00222457D3|nr:uncharacterized protein F5J12DRAFT_783420 [Pisolithus orientalis]KAI6004447.1 hypothetical protein F5J12DRAFT_783420 [Pisolithus orientalis]